MKTILLLFILIINSLSFAQKDSLLYVPKKQCIKAKENKDKSPKPFSPFLDFGIGPTVDLYSHQIGNVYRLSVGSNKHLMIISEVANYSRMNYKNKNSNMNEHEMSVTLNYGTSNNKRFFTYFISGFAHREVKGNETNLRSNKCNSFVLGVGEQINFKYISPFLETRIIKQDYSSEFVGLAYAGAWHQVVTAGINIHSLQEIEKYNFSKKTKKVRYHNHNPAKKTKMRKLNSCYFF